MCATSGYSLVQEEYLRFHTHGGRSDKRNTKESNRAAEVCSKYHLLLTLGSIYMRESNLPSCPHVCMRQPFIPETPF